MFEFRKTQENREAAFALPKMIQVSMLLQAIQKLLSMHGMISIPSTLCEIYIYVCIYMHAVNNCAILCLLSFVI